MGKRIATHQTLPNRPDAAPYVKQHIAWTSFLANDWLKLGYVSVALRKPLYGEPCPLSYESLINHELDVMVLTESLNLTERFPGAPRILSVSGRL